jgi:hypothetical protein
VLAVQRAVAAVEVCRAILQCEQWRAQEEQAVTLHFAIEVVLQLQYQHTLERSVAYHAYLEGQCISHNMISISAGFEGSFV